MPPTLHVVLYQPEIPPNTGNAGRLCVAIGARLHVVHPIAFSMGERAVRRAGLDYWRHVDLVEHEGDDAFWGWAEGRRIHLMSTRGSTPHTEARFEAEDVLMFGPETRGLPDHWLEQHGGLRIPMRPGPIRSLNLANAVAIVTFEAMRQIRPGWYG